MNMYVAPQRIKSLMEQLYNMQYQLKRIGDSYKEIESNLDMEIKKDPDVCFLMRQTGIGLEEVILNSAKYSQFMEYALEEYRKLEIRINEMARQEWEILLENRCNAKAETRVDMGKAEAVGEQRGMAGEKPCPLPKKELFTKSTVSPGSISNGSNILIRTWSDRE